MNLSKAFKKYLKFSNVSVENKELLTQKATKQLNEGNYMKWSNEVTIRKAEIRNGAATYVVNNYNPQFGGVVHAVAIDLAEEEFTAIDARVLLAMGNNKKVRFMPTGKHLNIGTTEKPELIELIDGISY